MTADEFAALDRIPTAAEFVAFARSQGYDFKVNGEKAALVADARDPVAVSLARMLGREPYRSNVLRALAEANNPANVERPEPPPPRLCPACKAAVYDPAAAGVLCDRLAGCPYFVGETPT